MASENSPASKDGPTHSFWCIKGENVYKERPGSVILNLLHPAVAPVRQTQARSSLQGLVITSRPTMMSTPTTANITAIGDDKRGS